MLANKNTFRNIAISLLSLLFVQCGSPNPSEKEKSATNEVQLESEPKELKPLFSKQDPLNTGIIFNNQLTENAAFNSFTYDYFYNGGGVAAGDIDNDGLVDLYFTGNMVKNRLYKNLGNWKFRDITDIANVAADNSWSTGASFVDINADGLLDIYVCRAFSNNIDERTNLLYINNGNSTFTESAKKYGLDDVGFSVHASFFDYDLDGDLDVFVANHPKEFQGKMGARYKKWREPKLDESNHLYINNGNETFTDVTEQAGLLSYDFTLGIITADINGDAYPDIYISNDYEFPDRYFMNMGTGAFQEKSEKTFRHTSHYSMGVDYADINNDSLADLVAVDMVAADNYRQKTMMPAMSIETFWRYVKAGYHYQYMRNTIQLNQGFEVFAEIGQLAGMAKTDWSWSVLLADFNLDGWKDMFVTNGYYRDTRNVDYVNNFRDKYGKKEVSITNEFLKEVLPTIPRQKINNYYFENQKNLHFKDQSEESGIDLPSFSNGAAYADLDNDGDLDLVISNLDDSAYIYRNQSIENKSGNYLVVKLQGLENNKNGIGSNITIRYGENIQNRQHIISRGYQSGVSNQIHFGLGAENTIDELLIKWPSGKSERIKNVKANQVLYLKEENAYESTPYPKMSTTTLFQKPTDNLGLAHRHVESVYDDFEKEILLPHKMSHLGPKVSVGDVNGDQLDDVFIGGAAGSVGSVYIQSATGTFKKLPSPSFAQDSESEDIGSAFFDSDGDGDLDLYVVSGGNEFKAGDKLYKDRLYLNDGSGLFKKSEGKIPDFTTSGSCVVAADYDKDGDLDLFIGGRQTPAKYPYPTNSYLLQNNNGVFTDVSKDACPDLESIGMVSTAIWSDFDQDEDLDLILSGEWMNIRFFENSNGKFTEVTKQLGLDSTTGWWNKIVECDLNNDGLMDYVIGNLGENYKYKASKAVPFMIYANDFDRSGTQDIVLGYDYKGDYYPVRGRECSSQQMPDIKKRFPSYHDFGQAKLIDIYGDKLQQSLHYEAFLFSSIILKNNGNGFEIKALPVESQFSTIQGIIVSDFTKDGIDDILLAGNFFVSEIETGRADASAGLLLKGEGDFHYTPLFAKDCGFYAPGDVRDLQLFNTVRKGVGVIVTNNNEETEVFTVRAAAAN